MTPSLCTVQIKSLRLKLLCQRWLVAAPAATLQRARFTRCKIRRHRIVENTRFASGVESVGKYQSAII
jgi:hypothetical protein